MKESGFQFSVTIDQAAAERCGLPEDIDARHLAILCMCEKYFAWQGAKIMEDGGKRYFLLDWEMVVQRLPRFGLNSRSRVKAIIKRLVEVGLLECHFDNNRLRQSWYCFGELYGEYSNFQASQIWDASPKNNFQASQEWDGKRPKSGTVSVPNLGRTMSNKDLSISFENNPPTPQGGHADAFQNKQVEKFALRNRTLTLLAISDAESRLGSAKFETMLCWLEHLRTKRKAFDNDYEIEAVVKEFEGKTLEELKAAVEFSKSKGYKTLVFQAGEQKKDLYPDDWSATIEARYTGQQLTEYWKHLHSKGWIRKYHQGQPCGWTKQKVS